MKHSALTNLRVYVIIFLSSLGFYSCEKATDTDKFYKGKFDDQFLLIAESDTVNIVLEQYPPETEVNKKNFIPYSVEIKDEVTDLITLKLFVLYGSYNQTPTVYKDAVKQSDTLYLWYSARKKISKSLYKSNLITENYTSPRLEYSFVDSVVIQKGRNKTVNFSSRILHF